MWRNLFILYFVFVKKQRTIERKKKRSKISGLESCYANIIYVLIGVELRLYGQKLVQFCKHTRTHTHASPIVVYIYKTWDRRKCSLLTVEGCSPKTTRGYFSNSKVYGENGTGKKCSLITIKRCSLIRGVHYERFHCTSIFP